jgi:AcrR family transcriptional regulator
MQQEFCLSTEQPAPGTLRPRGRTERVRLAVIAATRDLLINVGYEDLSIERVAEQAGVAKSTVYRRWRDRTGLLLELLDELSSVEIPFVDTGSVDEDIRVLTLGIAKFFRDHTGAQLALALIADAVHNPGAADGLRTFWARRNEAAAASVRQAIDRGELPADTDPVEVIRAIGAPLYYRLLVTHEPVGDDVAVRAAAAAVTAARAGVYARDPAAAH